MYKRQGCIIEKPLGNVAFDPELYKLLCQQMMLEAGVDMYMHSYLSSCQAKDGKISCICLLYTSYLYDGRSYSMKDMLKVHGPHKPVSEKELEELEEYVLSL